MNSTMDAGMGFGPRTGNDEPIRMSMQELHLTGRVLPIGATLNVRHVFESGESAPIEVIYAFALPRDAALRQFQISGKDFSVTSELMDIKEAEHAYEAGIESGSLSSLSRVYRDGIVNLAVGNIRPGETVVVQLELLSGVDASDDGFRFRFPFALAPGYHPNAIVYQDKPGVTEIELPEEFEGVILPPWNESGEGLHRVSFALEVPSEFVEVASPSHRIQVRRESGGQTLVTLATAGDVPNRDVVLDVKLVPDQVSAFVGLDSEGMMRFAALVPSTRFSTLAASPRRIVFLIDRSGSMDGDPMCQTLASVGACIGALTPDDQFGIVAFDDSVEATGPVLLAGDEKGRAIAKRFIATIDARGGTELFSGIEAATRLLGTEGGGDILLVTDGQVMGSDRICAQAAAMGVRIHCLGIGSASQDRFLSLLARQTGGIERFLTVRERVDVAALELFASIGSPVATAVQCEVCGITGGAIAPTPSRQVFAGKPLVLYGSCDSSDAGSLSIRWDQGTFEVPLHPVPGEVGDIVKLLQGARLITDAEAHLDSGLPARTVEKRAKEREERHLVSLSHTYGLASRLVALVAVVKREHDANIEPPSTRVVPVVIPEGSSFYAEDFSTSDSHVLFSRMSVSAELSSMSYEQSYKSDRFTRTSSQYLWRTPADTGRTTAERIRNTSWTLAAYMFEGYTMTDGPFSDFIKRLVSFLRLQDVQTLEPEQALTLTHLLEAAEAGIAPSGYFPLKDYMGECGSIHPRKFWGLIEAFISGPALRIETDGGMAGDTTEERIRKTSWALAILMYEGHTMTDGPFSDLIKRLVSFLRLQDVQPLDPNQALTLTHLLEAAEAGITPSGDLPRMKNKWECGSKPSRMVWPLLKEFISPPAIYYERYQARYRNMERMNSLWMDDAGEGNG